MTVESVNIKIKTQARKKTKLSPGEGAHYAQEVTAHLTAVLWEPEAEELENLGPGFICQILSRDLLSPAQLKRIRNLAEDVTDLFKHMTGLLKDAVKLMTTCTDTTLPPLLAVPAKVGKCTREVRAVVQEKMKKHHVVLLSASAA